VHTLWAYIYNGGPQAEEAALRLRGVAVRDEWRRGDIVGFYTPATGYRTGRYVRTVERGRDFGYVVVEPTMGVPRKQLKLSADFVWKIKDKEEKQG
jgi:hypothetical protein